MLEDFKSGYNLGKTSIKSITKPKAKELMDRIRDDLLNDNISEMTGLLFSELMTFFDPPINKKSDLSFVTSAVLKDKKEKQAYKLFGKYMDGIGFICTDSKRLHVLKHFKLKDENKPWYNPNTRKWLTEKEVENAYISTYPMVENVLKEKDKKCVVKREEFKVLDDDHIYIKLKDHKKVFKKRYFYDVIGSFVLPKMYLKDDKMSPLFIEDDTKLALIMPKC